MFRSSCCVSSLTSPLKTSPNLVGKDSVLLWRVLFSLQAFSLSVSHLSQSSYLCFLFNPSLLCRVSPSLCLPVCFSLSLSPCSFSPFLPVPCFPICFSSLLISVCLSGGVCFSVCFHFPCLWFGPVSCLTDSPDLSRCISLSLVSFLCLCFSLSLGPEGQNLPVSDPSGIGVWPQRMPSLFAVPAKGVGSGGVEQRVFPLPPAVGYGPSPLLGQRRPSAEGSGAFSPQHPRCCLLSQLLLTWASRALLLQHPRPEVSARNLLPLCPGLEPDRGVAFRIEGDG